MLGEMEFALSLAMKAGEIMRQNFSLGIHKEWKADNSPLTSTDTAINELVIVEVDKNFPHHGVIAEEGSRFGGEDYVWICDPVDGTNPFSHGYPTFTFSLALVRSGIPILGILYDPILERLVTAELGRGAYLNGRSRIGVDESLRFVRSIVALEAEAPKLRSELVGRGCLVTTFACISYPSLLVALGQFAAVMWFGKTPWDGAAVQIIIDEAGGTCTDIMGEKQMYDRQINGLIAGNKTIHPELIEMVKSSFIVL